jgi:hypothetical protein
MPSSVPRLSGLRLRLVSSLLRSPIGGPSLRRTLGALVVDRKIASVDFAAAGQPAPLYTPPPWRRP